jgi:hypothetical protein
MISKYRLEPPFFELAGIFIRILEYATAHVTRWNLWHQAASNLR